MRQKKAKKLNTAVYGEEYSPKFRKYYRMTSGQIIADEKRREYQALKKTMA